MELRILLEGRHTQKSLGWGTVLFDEDCLSEGAMRRTLSTIVVVAILVFAVVAAGGFAAVEDPADWIEHMRGSNGEARKQARTKLIEMGSEAVPTLIDATRDEANVIRWEAVDALGTIAEKYTDAVLPAVPALVERVLIDWDPHVRWRSLWALSVFPEEVGQTQIFPGLRQGLENDDPRIVWNAVVGRAFLKQPDVAPLLNQGVLENEGFAQWEAVFCLRIVHDDESILLLAELIVDVETSEKRLRQEAAMTLGQIGDPRAIPALVAALRDPEAHVRWRAAVALASLEAVEALEAIEAALEKETHDFAIKQMHAAIERLR
jgi:HEAT repeat protein